ncbi:effector-associated domain EAD1-containing protein [Micromonospora sp. S-DT3-3-22]|uniref:GAP1-N1 domain-containing protein n=1 Tax=Micromonospora sp. S-DT3-3-22 TaxID=2755359 RepID=UPI00188FD64A|nr:effector-associated domain EAD1-containing protein [Micromonospora sp. S-DT3-3-22]
MSGGIRLARFGNRGGAHTLLAHTGVDADLLGKIIWHTDAPPNSPDVIEPFASGYRLDDAYIVQVTIPDNTAARPGMVATTAAVVPISLLDELDLLALLARLEDTGDDLGSPMEAVPVSSAGPHEHPSGAGALASALLARRRAAWIGSGLADAVGCLWAHLSPSDRARVVFGAAFHPDGLSVPTNSASIVAVAIPSRAAARWSAWLTVGADKSKPADPAREALFGDDNGRAAALARDLDIGNAAFTQWRHLATAAELLASVCDLNHESTRALVQLLGLLQPASDEGQGPKRTALARLAAITPTARFADIRGLRGVPWQAMPSAPALADLLTDWTRAAFSDPLRGDDFADAATETVFTDRADAFGQALARALQDAADRLALSPVAEAILRHPRGADATTWLVRNASSRIDFDAALADAIEAVGIAPKWVVAAAAQHGLPRTHATAVDASVPAAAWKAHLSIRPRTDAADDILARRTGDVGTVRAALQVADFGLAERAGRLVAEQPGLLTVGDVADERFRAVWAAATRHGADPWQIVSPENAAAPLLALTADDQPVDDILLNALSRTSAADLSRYPDRARLWDRLPPGSIEGFKAATAAAVARSLQPGSPAPESQLQTAILAPSVLGAVAHDDAGQAVTVLRVLPAARPEHAELVVSRGLFTPTDATELARLVIDRRWKRTAETITDLARIRPDLRVAAHQVGQMFSTLERLRRLISFSEGVRDLATADELRDALHDTAARLYPGGPADNALWERTGGHDADLPDASTGRLRWGLALDAMMRGQHGAPPLNVLLDAMMSDYPNNPDLRVLIMGLQERKWT